MQQADYVTKIFRVPLWMFLLLVIGQLAAANGPATRDVTEKIN